MTIREILDSAAALICETVSEADSADYLERTPYILASFCSQCKRVDADYRRAYGLEAIAYPGRATLNYSECFPFVDELIPAATYYLAAMLVLDENEQLSDKLMDLYTDAVASLAASLPMLLERIAEKY